jgi:hypothetical protein
MMRRRKPKGSEIKKRLLTRVTHTMSHQKPGMNSCQWIAMHMRNTRIL